MLIIHKLQYPIHVGLHVRVRDDRSREGSHGPDTLAPTPFSTSVKEREPYSKKTQVKIWVYNSFLFMITIMKFKINFYDD